MTLKALQKNIKTKENKNQEQKSFGMMDVKPE
jgi:hypothetical protein